MEEKKLEASSGDSEDTEEYELDKSDSTAQHLKKRLQEKWDKMEAEKAANLKKALEEKKALKRKYRDDEEKKLAKFQKIDPHFNPKLRHAKRQIKKLKTSPPPPPPPQTEIKEDASEEVPPFRTETVEKLKQLQTDIVKLVKDHLPSEKSSEFMFLNRSLKDIVELLQKDVISYYTMGLINFSVKAIMYMAGISASDCKEGIESVKLFTELLSAMCEVVVEEINHRKNK